MSCEDWPCCGHEDGCCPAFDEDGKQLDMKCTCGKSLPVNSRYSLCSDCMNADDDEVEDPYADAWDEDVDEEDVDEEVDSDDDDHPYYHYEDEYDDPVGDY